MAVTRFRRTGTASALKAICNISTPAKEAGKPPPGADKVRSLGKLYMTPKWGNHRMTELSEIPVRVAEWCREDIKSAVSANHVARIMRAMWRRTAKRDPRLKLENFPPAPTRHAKSAASKRAWLNRFPVWFEAMKDLPPVHQAYHLVNLLTGARPGELARTPWDEDSPDADTFTIGNAKTGNASRFRLRRKYVLACRSRPTRCRTQDG